MSDHAIRPPRIQRHQLHTLLAIAWLIAALAVLDRVIPSFLGEGLPKADEMVVGRAEARLSLVRNGERYRTYPIALGSEPRATSNSMATTAPRRVTMYWKIGRRRAASIRPSTPMEKIWRTVDDGTPIEIRP